MKINGIEIKEYKTEVLFTTLKADRIVLKLAPWCALLLIAFGVLALCMIKTEVELMPFALFISGICFVLGFLALWVISRTKKIDEEIRKELDSRKLTEKQIALFNESYKSKSREAIKNFLYGFLAIIVVGLIMYGFQSCSNNDDYYSDRYDEVFHKDPNTWTKEDKDYVNNLFDYIDENDNNK